MPANNSKIMSDILLKKMNEKYVISYEEETNEIIVSLTNCARKTIHSADKPFHINSKKPKRKVCFSLLVIDLWKEFQKSDKTKTITLFDVQNAVTELKIMYQKITQTNVLNTIKHKQH